MLRLFLTHHRVEEHRDANSTDDYSVKRNQ